MNAIVKLINMAEHLTASGSIGDGMVAEFHNVAKDAACALNAQSDREIAIGEHAFKAGYETGHNIGSISPGLSFDPEIAWSNYTPPEFD